MGTSSWGVSAVGDASVRLQLGEVGNCHVATQRAELGLQAEHDPAVVEHLADHVMVGTARFSDRVVSDIRDQAWVDVLVQQYQRLNSGGAKLSSLQSLVDNFLRRCGHGGFL